MKLKLMTILILTCFVSGAWASQKIGFVNVPNAILGTKAGKAAKKKIEAEVEKRKKELDKKRVEFETMQKDFEKKSMVLSDDVKQKKGAELQREGMKLQQMYMQSQQDLQAQERALQEPILKTMKLVIDELAKNEKYDLILENALFASKSVDLTSKVIKAFEKKHKK